MIYICLQEQTCRKEGWRRLLPPALRSSYFGTPTLTMEAFITTIRPVRFINSFYFEPFVHTTSVFDSLDWKRWFLHAVSVRFPFWHTSPVLICTCLAILKMVSTWTNWYFVYSMVDDWRSSKSDIFQTTVPRFKAFIQFICTSTCCFRKIKCVERG